MLEKKSIENMLHDIWLTCYVFKVYRQMSTWEELLNSKLHGTFGYPSTDGNISKSVGDVKYGIQGAKIIMDVLDEVILLKPTR